MFLGSVGFSAAVGNAAASLAFSTSSTTYCQSYSSSHTTTTTDRCPNYLLIEKLPRTVCCLHADSGKATVWAYRRPSPTAEGVWSCRKLMEP